MPQEPRFDQERKAVEPENAIDAKEEDENEILRRELELAQRTILEQHAEMERALASSIMSAPLSAQHHNSQVGASLDRSNTSSLNKHAIVCVECVAKVTKAWAGVPHMLHRIEAGVTYSVNQWQAHVDSQGRWFARLADGDQEGLVPHKYLDQVDPLACAMSDESDE